MEVSTTFPEMRNRRRKAQFDYECADEMNRLRLHPSSDLRQISSTNFWIRRWFQFSHGSSIPDWNSIFGFLCRYDTLVKIHDTNQLQKYCLYLFEKMGDIETNELLMEISRFVAVFRRDNQADCLDERLQQNS